MRNNRVKRGIIGLIIGIILAVFGWADIQYWLTPLSYEVDQIILYIGGLMSIFGIGYIIYGIIEKSPTSYPSVQPQTTHPQPRPVSDSSFCTQCGHQMDQNTTFCPNCGFRRS